MARLKRPPRATPPPLLLRSLMTLHKEGCYIARAVCKDATTAAKFIYPKFGSVCETYDLDPFNALS